jgi:hypothetical protein
MTNWHDFSRSETMRELNLQETKVVAGGNDKLSDPAQDAGLGQPDSSSFTASYPTPTGTLTVKCVDYRRELHSGDLGSGSGI